MLFAFIKECGSFVGKVQTYFFFYCSGMNDVGVWCIAWKLMKWHKGCLAQVPCGMDGIVLAGQMLQGG